MFPGVTFILGGAASGKSEFAEEFVKNRNKTMHYVATSQVLDSEMRAKAARHAARRGADWHLHEAPDDPAPVLQRLGAGDICLIDCATMWLSNRMLAGADLDTETARLLETIAACPGDLVIVSNEVGQGIVPDNALAREFREAQGRLNIRLAAGADLAIQVVAGLPVILKGTLP